MKGQTNPSILVPKLQRRLRSASTDAERLLWRRLRTRQLDGCKFRRQHPFGDFVLDFVWLERMVAIELDGSQHAECIEADAVRTAFLKRAGFCGSGTTRYSMTVTVSSRRFSNRWWLHANTIPTQALPLKGRESGRRA